MQEGPLEIGVGSLSRRVTKPSSKLEDRVRPVFSVAAGAVAIVV
jgi:hypothetical protein